MSFYNSQPMKLILINPDKCTNCLACVRACPVHAIEIRAGKELPQVNDQRCIGCGSCLNSCRYDALSYHRSIPEVKTLLQSSTPVVAIVDPSISGEFPDITDYRKFVEMIRSLGFSIVLDISFGVDLVARAYQRLFSEKRGKYYITANCPAIVAYVQKFSPLLTGNLAPIVNPALAMARVATAKYGPQLRIVLIGPCIAAKREVRRLSEEYPIDEVLTFAELREMFRDQQIHESQLEYSEFDPPEGREGSLYPVSSGILEAAAIDQSLISGDVVTAEGRWASLDAVDSFEKYIDTINRHFNLFYNEGCVMGPGMTGNRDKQLRNSLVVAYARKRLGTVDLQQWEQHLREFASIPLQRTFVPDDQRLPDPEPAKVEEILHLIGKSEVNYTNCSSCGFRSCSDFAAAVAQGISRTDVCLEYSVRTKNNYIQTLREANKKLKEELQGLKSEFKKVHDDYQLVNEKLETAREIMNQIPTGVIIADDRLKVTSCNRAFIDMLGDEAREIDQIIPGLRGADLKSLVPVAFYKLFQNVLESGENILSRDIKMEDSLLNVSVFSIKKHKVVGAIVRDMYSPEVRNEQIIQRITEVIDQNLEMVQQIGFLLGEGASKTEAMLNSIIEMHRMKKKK